MRMCTPTRCFIVIAAAGGLAGLALIVRRLGAGQETPGPTVWERMQEKMESMPEDFPPRVMFDNVAAIREDTARLIDLLEPRASELTEEAGDAS